MFHKLTDLSVTVCLLLWMFCKSLSIFLGISIVFIEKAYYFCMADVTGMGAYCPTTNVVRPYANFLLLDEVNSSLCGSSTHRGLLNRPLLLEDISFLSWNEVNISS